MSISLIMSLAKGLFAVESQFAQQAFPYVNSLLTRETPEGNFPGMNERGGIFPYAVHATIEGQWLHFDQAPANSIMVLPVHNVIMKYDYCGEFGTMSMVQVLEKAYRHKNIAGVVIDMDSPGGEVFGTRTLSEAIANSPKPVITCVRDGMCASGGYYTACKSNLIVATSPTDWIGSIGVLWTLVDVRGAYEKKGYKLHEIYSPDSPEKNKDVRDAFEGKPEGVQKALQVFDKYFMESVTNGRGEKLNKDVLKGGMYFANDAKEMGLIDDIMPFNDVIKLCTNMSGRSMIIS